MRESSRADGGKQRPETGSATFSSHPLPIFADHRAINLLINESPSKALAENKEDNIDYQTMNGNGLKLERLQK